jgi:hypothetical protein
MKKIILSTALASLIFSYAHAIKVDSMAHREKKPTHLVGIQANALVRQIFNLGNVNNSINNPYLLTYGYIGKKHSWGLDVGLGYNLINAFTNDGNTKTENKVNDVNFRIGVQKPVILNKRFTATFYVHALLNTLNSNTKSEESFGSQFTRITTNTNNGSIGFGPAASLRYRIANRVFIGTEANYYLRMGNTKSDVTTYTVFTGGGGGTTTASTKTDNDFTNFSLVPPAVLFLIVRL